MTINEERVRLLVDALRSGDFKQGQNLLRSNDDKYCCLGVACEIARLNGIGIEWGPKNEVCTCETCMEGHWAFDGSTEALSHQVAEWYGFTPDDRFLTRDPEIAEDEYGNTVTMIRANDDLGWNFSQIADALAKKYLNEGDAA